MLMMIFLLLLLVEIGARGEHLAANGESVVAHGYVVAYDTFGVIPIVVGQDWCSWRACCCC